MSHIQETPLISILLTNFNREQYLRKAIDSVLAQTYTNWCLIIVDDASTDGSKEILQEYQQKYSDKIRVQFNDMNYGTYYCLNQALVVATGAYFVKIDSDDYYSPDKLMIQLTYCQKTPAELCTCNTVRVSKHSRQLINNSSTLFFSRRIFEEFGYFDNCRFDCDCEYIKRISTKYIIPNVKQVLDYKYLVSDSLTQSSDTGCHRNSIGQKIRLLYKGNSQKFHSRYIHHPKFVREKYKTHPFHRCPLEIEFLGLYTHEPYSNGLVHSTRINVLENIVQGRVIYKLHTLTSTKAQVPVPTTLYQFKNPQKWQVNIFSIPDRKQIFSNYVKSSLIQFQTKSSYIEVQILFPVGIHEYSPLLLQKREVINTQQLDDLVCKF